MSRVAASWNELKSTGAHLLWKPAGEVRSAEHSPPHGGRLRGTSVMSPHHLKYKPTKQRSRSVEMHSNIVSSAQEAGLDKTRFWALKGAVLHADDGRHKGRPPHAVISSAPTREASGRTSSVGAAAASRVDEKRGGWIKLDSDITLDDLHQMQNWVKESPVEQVSRHLGIGRHYASSVVGSFQKTGTIPEVDASGPGRGGNRRVGDAPNQRYSKADISQVQNWVFEQAIAGLNVYTRSLAAKLYELTGHHPSRRAVQRLRNRLGIVYGKVVGASGAKTSRRVRQYRHQFVERRMREEGRPRNLIPIRVYQDESYVNSNTAGLSRPLSVCTRFLRSYSSYLFRCCVLVLSVNTCMLTASVLHITYICIFMCICIYIYLSLFLSFSLSRSLSRATLPLFLSLSLSKLQVPPPGSFRKRRGKKR